MFTKESREYKPNGRYLMTRKNTHETQELAAEVANLEVEFFSEVPDVLKELTPCNIIVRGPNGRFVKWRN